MNAKALSVVLVALLAAAGAFLWFLRGGEHEPAPAPAPTAPAAPAAAAASAAAAPLQASLKANAAPTAAPDAGAREAAPVVNDGKVQDGITLRGRLVDSHAAPRGGVVLALNTWEPMDGIEIENLPPPPGVRDRERRDRPTWTTRPDGTFLIPMAKQLVGELDLVTDGLVFQKPMGQVSGKKGDRDLGDIVVLQEASIAGVVQDERGQPVAGVRVTAMVDAIGIGGTTSTTTKADGLFRLGMLRSGKWAVRTASGKFLPAVVEIEVAAEEQKTGVVVLVKPGNAIAGQVVDDRGVGVAGIKVGSKRKEATGGVTIERFSPTEATTTDANGFFTLSGLAEEAVTVRAFGPGHSSVVAVDVPIGTGNLVLRIERCGVLEGVLVGVDGAPIAGSRVRASVQSGVAKDPNLELAEDALLGGFGEEERTVTAADGSFRLASVRPGNVTVTARGDAHRPVSAGPFVVQPAQVTKGVRLVADAGATAKVTVKDEAGKPVAGATVTADRAGAEGARGNRGFTRRVEVEDHGGGPVRIGAGDHLGTAKTDGNGVAVIAGLPAVEVSLTAKHESFAAPTPVKLMLPKAGVLDAALTMRQPGVAEFVVTGSDGAPLMGVDVKVAPDGDEAGGEPQQVTTGEGGTARLASLSPGNYTAALTKARGAARLGNAMVFVGNEAGTIGSSTQRFTVVAGQTVKVALQKPVLAKVHGVVTGVDGPAAGCVVELTRQDGDEPELPGFGGRNATTAGDGTFAFDDVEAGSYQLSFGKPEQLVKAQQSVEVPANTSEVRQDLALRTGKVRVQIVAKGSGDPVSKAEVELVRAESAGAGGKPRPQRRVMMVSMVMSGDPGGGEGGEATSMTVGNQRAFTDDDGIAEIDDVPVGNYTLRVKHRKQAPFEKKDVTVDERQTADLGRIELGAAGLIRGKVTMTDGKVARMALVTSRPVDSDQWSEPVMAQGGNYRVQGLAAGKYKIRAQALGGGERYSPEIEVEVKAGETAQADLQLPPE